MGVTISARCPNITNPVYFDGKPLTSAVALKSGSLLRIGGQDPGMMVSLEYRAPQRTSRNPAHSFQ